MKKIKVTSKGQITLPQSMRDALKIKEGDYLDVVMEKNSLVLKLSPRNCTEILVDYCEKYSAEKASLEETRKVLGKVPYSLSEKTAELRRKAEDE